MKPKISVIVPIYNVEKYLKKCVDSLLSQTLKEIEIILVDDESPDLSGKIADEYGEKHRNIKIIHRKNGGLGAARNTGLKNATGEYVAFLDSDDWVQEDMYEKLYTVAIIHNADIVVSGHCDVSNGVTVLQKQHPLKGKIYNSADEIREIRKNLFGHDVKDTDVESFPMSVCMSIYNRKMLADYHLRFETILSEDTIFNISAYKFAKKIIFTEYTDYCYRKDEQESITHTFSKNKKEQFKNFLQRLRYLAEEENDENYIMRSRRMAIDYCRFYIRIVGTCHESFKNKKMYIKEFAQDQDIVNLWSGYPIDTLPIQQKIFQKLIEKKCYGLTLILNELKRHLEKRH
ncbi:MAG: glycosyltransferase [Faecalimonas umbilicata]|uniref:glycosyltransferase n=1 Tax=Faecalimonas umbilicata TaxID=1912855 RepID=UPI003994D2CF